MIRVQASKEMVDEMQQQTDLSCLDIKGAQDRQKAYADTTQSDRFFNEGDMAFLRVRQKKSSLSLGKYKKLSAWYCGPYRITKKINDQAYELFLPPHVKVHNVFHIILLKRYVPDNELPLVTQEGTLDITPEAILQTRVRTLQNCTINKYPIKWTSYPDKDAT